ncbi:hypothetical protein HMPREF9441_00483 [Paraprevotella clara YIT 11840]|uniref:Uncharacterized protein n=1 Tax=Paraprevotella clara YIT 11840 TaxID=762968 RepID=G5SMA9_9BACT|nr:hypothetical protein HMPREF9441_00483 [Paraprevotella clara YIT 11840]
MGDGRPISNIFILKDNPSECTVVQPGDCFGFSVCLLFIGY